MHSKARNYCLVLCLFVFLFVIIGGGLHVNPGGAFLAAATGTPLVICVLNRRFNEASRSEEGRAESLSNEVAYVSRKTESKIAFLMPGLLGVRLGSQASGVCGSFGLCAVVWTSRTPPGHVPHSERRYAK